MNTDVKGWRRWLLRFLLPGDGVHAVIVADRIVAVETLNEPVITSQVGGFLLTGSWSRHIPYAPPWVVVHEIGPAPRHVDHDDDPRSGR